MEGWDWIISAVCPGSMVLVEVPMQQSLVTVYCFYLKSPLGIYTFLALSSLSCTQLLRPSFFSRMWLMIICIRITWGYCWSPSSRACALESPRTIRPSAAKKKPTKKNKIKKNADSWAPAQTFWSGIWEWILEIHIFNVCVQCRC